MNAKKMMHKFIYAVLLCACASVAQADKCSRMADMSKDAATLREAGVPLAAIENRLRKDVTNKLELSEGLTVARLVYQTDSTPEQLHKAVLAKCRKLG